jgi:hypothetical protein
VTPVPTRPELRAADSDRDTTVERLAAAMSEGRLRLDEYHQRLERAYTATTHGDLDRLVADLPSPAAPAQVTEQPRGRRCCW